MIQLRDFSRSGEGVIEKRKARRFKVEWNATIRGKDHQGGSFNDVAKLANLSSHGAFLYLNRQVRIGMKLDLSIKLPFDPERWMNYSVEVVRTEDEGRRVCVAVKFTNIRPMLVF